MGKIFIISGPSGVGKDTIIDMLRKKHPDYKTIITYTTRKPRAGDRREQDYHFVSKAEFEKMISSEQLAEWAKVHRHYYGSKKEDYQNALRQNNITILAIDVNGAVKIKKIFPEVVLFFLKYENLSLLKERLIKDPNRKGINKKEIQTRFQTAQKEMKYEKYYDYSVINYEGKPEKAVREIEKIIEIN